MLRKKSMLAAAVCAAVFASASASAALAGEITGNGKPTAGPAHANSICVFSGRNDDPGAPISLDPKIAPNGPGGVSQSYGQDVRNHLIDPHLFNPGAACRGGSN
jgi:opacity protein-like surface antigen